MLFLLNYLLLYLNAEIMLLVSQIIYHRKYIKNKIGKKVKLDAIHRMMILKQQFHIFRVSIPNVNFITDVYGNFNIHIFYYFFLKSKF